MGLWQVAVVWGVAVALAIYAFGAASGAHLNPAMTVAFVVLRGFPPRKALWYFLAQTLGAVMAALLLYLHYKGALAHFEAAAGIVRGQPGSELSAMTFGEYFPHPGIKKALGWSDSVTTLPMAALAEFVGTIILGAMVFSITDPKNQGGPGAALGPAFIGLTVAVVISVLAPMTQVGLNPARDFGPRLVSYFLGWGSVAIPGPSGGFFTVYILAPCLGAVAGAYLYQVLTRYDLVNASDRDLAQTDASSPKLELRRSPVSIPKLLIIGGFLGAGKTTLLGRAREVLESQGLKVGVLTNDQAPGLVDTVWLGSQKTGVAELTGSCFCCNFNGFEKALSSLTQWGAEVILAEPVGSCVDLSATILQPLKDLAKDKYQVAPFSVVLDPIRAKEVLGLTQSLLHRDAFYILGLQVAEADLIVLNKTDLLKEAEKKDLMDQLTQRYPEAKVVAISAREGFGVSEFLAGLLASPAKAGAKLLEVDYDRYANGEAVLGWLNLTVENDFASRPGAALLKTFLESLRTKLLAASQETGHIKVLWPSPEGFFTGNLIDTHQEPLITKAVAKALPGPVLVNARVESEPSDLEKLVRATLAEVVLGDDQKAAIKEAYCLKPGRPNPTHRYAQVI
jgi:MIP family channel proteins